VAASSPSGWDRFTRINLEPHTIETEPALLSAGSPASGRLAMRSATFPRAGVGAMFLRGISPLAGASIGAARDLITSLGVGGPRASDWRSLRLAADLRSRVGRTVVLQQHVRGYDVVGGHIKVHFGRTGEFVVTGRPLADLRERTPQGEVGSTPRDAKRAAARAFDLDAASVRETELQSFPMSAGEARWVWRVGMVVDQPKGDDPVADVRAYLDASTLEVLLSYNIASALRGRANVFPQNPGRTPELQEVALWDLGPIPGDQLAGPRLIVLPGAPPPFLQAARDFRLTDDAQGFDEPNAYFQLRSALRYYTALQGRRRFASPPFRPVRAIVRDRASRNNAYFLPSVGTLRFGDFDTWPTTRPSARSADMLYHELGHAVSDNAAKLGRSVKDSQARGLSEGYSDYFANSALNDPRMCDWVAPDKARDSSNPNLRFAPDFTGPEHETGSAWAAVLWGIRRRTGQHDADRIAFESMYLLGPDSTFGDGREALLTVSEELARSGKIDADHADVIDAEWQRRIAP
jgi:hypothetical protein